MNISTYSLSGAHLRLIDEGYLEQVKHGEICLISIVNSNVERQWPENENILQLTFDDVAPDDKEGVIAWLAAGKRPFGKPDLEAIESFVDRALKLPQCEEIMIHCHAGTSRSGAVALIAGRRAGLKPADIFRQNEGLKPNTWMLHQAGLPTELSQPEEHPGHDRTSGNMLTRLLKNLFGGRRSN